MALIYKIKYDTSFIEDLKYFNEELGEKEFKNIMKQFYSKSTILKKFPKMYQRIEIPNNLKEEFRRMIIKKYIFIYEIDSKSIIFLKIFHEKTNYIKQLKRLNRI